VNKIGHRVQPAFVFLIYSPVQRDLVRKVSRFLKDRGAPGLIPRDRRSRAKIAPVEALERLLRSGLAVTAVVHQLCLDIAARYPLKPSYMRKVLKSPQGPLEIKPQEKSVWICMCGLSKNQPFCDGSHKKTRDEEEGKIYEYDDEGHRREVG